MKQVIVGGDNQDANLICDAFERELKQHRLPILLCTTHQEVLSNLERGGGADLVVLGFENAGLTNFEIAHRIREMRSAGQVPILLPDVDALGDIRETLGPLAAVFQWPANPVNIVSKAKLLLETARKQKEAQPETPPSEARRAAPPPAFSRVPRPEIRRVDSAGLTPVGESGESARGRRRRIRHRSWDEIQNKKPARAGGGDSAERILMDEDVVITGESGQADARAKLRLAAILFGLALAIVAGYGIFALVAGAGRDERGFETELMCTRCGYREARVVKDIHEIFCRKCGKPMGFAFHCNDCNKDFGFLPGEKIRTRKQLKTKPECPSCHSWNVTELQPAPKSKPKSTSKKK